MKRFLIAAIAAATLLVPTLTFAQVRTVYIPGAHPRVVVVPENGGQALTVSRAPLTPSGIIAIHTRMATAQRGLVHVNHSAVAHCDRLVVDARAALRNF